MRWDSVISEFGVRICPSGKKALLFRYRVNGSKRLRRDKTALKAPPTMNPERLPVARVPPFLVQGLPYGPHEITCCGLSTISTRDSLCSCIRLMSAAACSGPR